MTVRRTTLAGHTYEFTSLSDLLAKATPARSGDVLAGCAAESQAQRVAAQTVLADVPLQVFLDEHVVAPEDDDVTRLILDTHDRTAFAPIASQTVGEFREWLLARAADGDEAAVSGLGKGLTPEMVAATSKLMRNADLVAVGRRARVVTGLRSTLGLPGRLASRLQPTTRPTTRSASPRRCSTGCCTAAATRSSASTRRPTRRRRPGRCSSCCQPSSSATRSPRSPATSPT